MKVEDQVVRAPAILLLDPGPTPATKIIWMAMRLQHAANPAAIEACTGLSRPTVLSGAARARKLVRTTGGPRVKVPSALMAEPALGAQAKVLYGLLQTTPEFRGHTGQFTYASLSSQTGLSPNALKRAVTQLAGGGWLRLSQKNRRSPIRFTLTSPALLEGQDEVEVARERLKLAKYGGEAIMQEWLTALIASTYFTDNARPGFLVNPLTHARLELDRFYPPDLAFEYHGSQHSHQTERFDQVQVDSQRLRDLIKAGICVYEGIRLIIIRDKDLSLEGMIRKIGPNLPLRDRTAHALLIDFLEDVSISYVASCPTR